VGHVGKPTLLRNSLVGAHQLGLGEVHALFVG
jgi:hypothetical protein